MLEITLTDGAVAFLGLDGEALPKPGEPFTAEQRLELSQWQAQVTGFGLPAVQACLDAAKGMYGRLSPIDQVAWDWIPAEPEPLPGPIKGPSQVRFPPVPDWDFLEAYRS